MKTFVRCFVCYRVAVELIPIPLCKTHRNNSGAPIGSQDSDEELVFEDLDADDYNPYPGVDEFPIPIYPI